MRRILTVAAALVAVAAFSSMALAQTGGTPDKAKAQAEKAATAKPAKPAPMAVTGKIAKFDEATMSLTVTATDGDKTFTLTPTTKIHSGAKSLKEAALTAGTEVKVTYTEAEGKMTATNIAVSSSHAATAPAKTPAKR